MKKLSLMIGLLFVVYHVAYLPEVCGQPKADEITVAEKTAARELADRFIKKLGETGDVEPLIREMFASDFISRYVGRKRQEVREGHVSINGIMFTSGLEYHPGLLETANDEDWRALYVNTFNFMNYGFTFMVNVGANSKAAGKEIGEGEIGNLMGKMYPPAVIKLLNSDLILRNMLKMGSDHRPIKDVERTFGGSTSYYLR